MSEITGKAIYQSDDPDSSHPFLGFFTKRNKKGRGERLPVYFIAENRNSLIERMDNWLAKEKARIERNKAKLPPKNKKEDSKAAPLMITGDQQ